MKQSIKQRLTDFIYYKRISVSKFEKLIEVSNGYVNNLKKNIGTDKLEKILRVFPDLDPEWLLFGNGEMIKNPSTSSVSVVGDNNAVSNAVNNSNCKIAHATDIQAQNTALREQVNKLQNELALLTKQNQRLTTKLLDYMEGENK